MKGNRTVYMCGAILALGALLLASCAHLPRETRGEHYPHLKDLSWMIGEWTDTQDNKTVTNVCRWSRNRNFITRTFEVAEEGQPTIKGTEIIGWDPAENLIRSWTFDSQGGFAAAIWVLENGKWKSEIIEDLAPPEPALRRESLAHLDWMAGTWVDEGEEGEENLVELTSKWVGDKAFLVVRFTAYDQGEPDQEGVVIIGWDDQQKTIRSWMFDTDGGLAEGRGVVSKGTWQMKNRHVLPDGRRASSVTIYKKIDKNSFSWRRIAQEVEGELLPDMDEIVVVRQTTSENPQ